MTAMLEKKTLSAEDLEAQAVLELPDRELLGGVYRVHKPGGLLNLVVLVNLINLFLKTGDIKVLNGNTVDITVIDGDVNVFCNQVIAILAAQCFKK
jgi:hypothetical protein